MSIEFKCQIIKTTEKMFKNNVHVFLHNRYIPYYSDKIYLLKYTKKNYCFYYYNQKFELLYLKNNFFSKFILSLC